MKKIFFITLLISFIYADVDCNGSDEEFDSYNSERIEEIVSALKSVVYRKIDDVIYFGRFGESRFDWLAFTYDKTLAAKLEGMSDSGTFRYTLLGNPKDRGIDVIIDRYIYLKPIDIECESNESSLFDDDSSSSNSSVSISKSSKSSEMFIYYDDSDDYIDNIRYINSYIDIYSKFHERLYDRVLRSIILIEHISSTSYSDSISCNSGFMDITKKDNNYEIVFNDCEIDNIRLNGIINLDIYSDKLILNTIYLTEYINDMLFVYNNMIVEYYYKIGYFNRDTIKLERVVNRVKMLKIYRDNDMLTYLKDIDLSTIYTNKRHIIFRAKSYIPDYNKIVNIERDVIVDDSCPLSGMEIFDFDNTLFTIEYDEDILIKMDGNVIGKNICLHNNLYDISSSSYNSSYSSSSTEDISSSNNSLSGEGYNGDNNLTEIDNITSLERVLSIFHNTNYIGKVIYLKDISTKVLDRFKDVIDDGRKKVMCEGGGEIDIYIKDNKFKFILNRCNMIDSLITGDIYIDENVIKSKKLDIFSSQLETIYENSKIDENNDINITIDKIDITDVISGNKIVYANNILNIDSGIYEYVTHFKIVCGNIENTLQIFGRDIKIDGESIEGYEIVNIGNEIYYVYLKDNYMLIKDSVGDIVDEIKYTKYENICEG